MATRRAQFFICRDEFLDVLDTVASELGLVVVSMQPGGRGVAVVSVDDLRGSSLRRIYLAQSEPSGDTLLDVQEGLLSPGKWGWVELDLPIEDAGSLLLASIGTKSEWVDAQGRSYDNPAVLVLFKKITSGFRPLLTGPVWAGQSSSDVWREYRDLRYSECAARWRRSGGHLKQEGVLNVEYEVDDPTGGRSRTSSK